MSKFVRKLTSEELEKLTKLAKSRAEPAGLVQRARLVLRSSRRETVPRIAAAEGVSKETVRKWHNRFNSQGIEGLKDKEGRGRPCIYSKEICQQIVALGIVSPRQLGQDFDVWTQERFRRYLKEQKGISISRTQVGRILKREGIRLNAFGRGPGRGKSMRPRLGKQATFY